MVPRGEGAALSTAGKARAPTGAGSELTGRAGLAHRLLEAYLCGQQPKGSNLALLPGGLGTLQVIAASSSFPGARRLSICPCPLAPGRRLSPNHDGAHSDPVTHVNTPEPGGSEREVEPRG